MSHELSGRPEGTGDGGTGVKATAVESISYSGPTLVIKRLDAGTLGGSAEKWAMYVESFTIEACLG